MSLDHTLHNGWSMDHQGLPPVDMFMAADPDAVAAALAALLPARLRRGRAARAQPVGAAGRRTAAGVRAWRPRCGARSVTGRYRCCTCRCRGTAPSWPFRHPLDFLGSDGGGGIGGGPGISVGAALALRGSGRLAGVGLRRWRLPDGRHALWTAAHYGIPLLIVVANNQSFFNDEVHQERMARLRGRPVENKWIGMRMTEPEIDLAGLARAQGAQGFGPVQHAADMDAAFAEAIAAVEAGAVAVVDVRVAPGYTPAMASALTRH